MKIKGSTNKPVASSVKGSGSSGSVSAGKKSSSARESDSARTASAVSVSTTGMIEESLSLSSSSRAAKVAQIKLDVENGSYKSDPQQTADKLIDSLTDYSLA